MKAWLLKWTLAAVAAEALLFAAAAGYIHQRLFAHSIFRLPYEAILGSLVEAYVWVPVVSIPAVVAIAGVLGRRRLGA